MRPSMLLTAEKVGMLRSVAEVRDAITAGHAKTLWERLYAVAREELDAEPLLPTSRIPGRAEVQAQHANRDYDICHAAGERLLRAALVMLLTGETAHRDAALRQAEALFDPARWPEWRDLAHPQYPADLRAGQLAHDMALAYDWLHPFLTDAQRAFLLEGMDRCGIQPYLHSVAKGAWWARWMSNWMTCIVGGFGVVGMALGEDYPGARPLIDYSLPLMRNYLTMYGPDGEFNESVAYATAIGLPVGYFMAYRYHTRDAENLLAQSPFPQACRWLMHLTLPPGRTAAFGDSGYDYCPDVTYVAAVASAAGDGILQRYYLDQQARKNRGDAGGVRELLWYDAALAPLDPQGRLPLGKAFPAHGGCLVQRTDWNPDSTACVVYGKAGREDAHEHNDIGQLCIDGYGQRLIVDLGPPLYPEDYFGPDRWQYYTAGVVGHNVLQFGGREMRHDSAARGTILHATFDETLGGQWLLDLTAAYNGATRVRRAVAHLFPGIVAVLDEAELAQAEAISLRWHTADRAEPDADGSFVVENAGVQLSARVVADSAHCTRGEHEYRAPYNRMRLDELLEQRRESYVEVTATAQHCRWLSLFAVLPPGAASARWEECADGWAIGTSDGDYRVTLTAEHLRVMRLGEPAREIVVEWARSFA